MEPYFPISVVVPCLNEERCLPLFLTSLENQFAWNVMGCSSHWMIRRKRFPLELVIVDGGSTDRSRALVDLYRSRIPITAIIDKTRNLGYVRNRGATSSRGDLLFFTNSDTILPADLLHEINYKFQQDPKLIALSGRTVPINGGILSIVAYTAFDWLRWLFTKLGKFSPSGNFLVLRTSAYFDIGGFQTLRVNEDGELGSRLSKFARQNGSRIHFMLHAYVWHHAKRFRGNSLKALFFYLYIFGNFHPILQRILQPIQQKSAREFSRVPGPGGDLSA